VKTRDLRVIRVFDPWKSPLCTCPPKYSLQPYTRCSHQCLYCYATSYIGRGRSTPKKNLLRNLLHDLKYIDKKYHINLSTSSDPYPPEELEYKLTREVLRMLINAGCRVLITTKSSLVTRDLEVIARGRVAVMITVTTLDSNLARVLEPGAPSPGERLHAIEELAKRGIPVGVRIDPIIPYLNDEPDELRELVKTVIDLGARHVVTSTYKAKPDNLARMCQAYPDLAQRWKRLYVEGGSWIHGYWYLSPELRKKLLKPVVEVASARGITYAVCREGLTSETYFKAPTCDGSHLIP